MAVNPKMPGIFTTPGESYETRTDKSAGTHARPAFIGTEYGYADPAVGLFVGKKFLGILHIDDAERLTQEIQVAINQHHHNRRNNNK